MPFNVWAREADHSTLSLTRGFLSRKFTIRCRISVEEGGLVICVTKFGPWRLVSHGSGLLAEGGEGRPMRLRKRVPARGMYAMIFGLPKYMDSKTIRIICTDVSTCITIMISLSPKYACKHKF
eukprot:GEMP01106333.1.p1 GENE.GEMP01106333.1~~GEMP01106333.1.p1  ORF type:complete len:123 (+),score=0.25 GEMP01106333.1:41-409(+)